MTDENLEEVFQSYCHVHGLNPDMELHTDTVDTLYLRLIFMAGYNTANAGFNEEWGIAYKDNEDGRPVDPIRNPQAAKGIFGHYGIPGDKLVKRRVWDWETVEEKSAPAAD